MLRTVEDRDVRFIRLWFTDVLGFLKSFAITPAELEGAFERGMEFDGSAIEGYARVQEADMVAKPDPGTFQVLPGRGDGGVARMFCDVLTPEGEPFDGDPRWVLRRNLERAAARGFTVYVMPGAGVLPVRRRRDGPAAGHRVVLRPDRPRPVPGLPPHRHRHAGADGHLGDAVPPRDRPQPARDRPARGRRPDHGRQRHERPPGGQGGRPRAGPARHLHAQAARGGGRVGHGHPPVAVRGRPQRLLRPRAGGQPVQDGPQLHRRAAEPRPRVHRRDQPVDQLLQAAGPRLRRPDPRLLGPAQPLGHGQGGRLPLRPGRRRGPLARPGRQPLPRLRGAAGRRA